MDDVTGWEFHRPRTAGPGISNDSQGVGAWNPIGVHDPLEQVATSAARHRHPPQRTRPEGPNDVLRTEEHGHIAGVGNRQDLSRLEAEVPRIRAARTAEKHFVRLPIPAGAVDEALAIGREPRRRHVAMPVRHAPVFGDGWRDRHRCSGPDEYGDSGDDHERTNKAGPKDRPCEKPAPRPGGGTRCCAGRIRIRLGDPAKLGHQVTSGLPSKLGILGETPADYPL
jgi:hypothetical protein